MKLNIKQHHIIVNHYKRLLIILSLLVPFILSAQVQELNTVEEVTVIAPFNPSIRKANKLNFTPILDTNQANKLKIDYLTTPKLFNINYTLETMEAAKFIDKRRPHYPQNIIKLGYGIYNTPYGEVFINDKISRTSQVGIHFRHLSTSGNIKDVAYSGGGHTAAEVWTKHVHRKQTTNLNVNFKRNQVHQYGFNPEDYPLEYAATSHKFKNDINQVYSKTGITLDMIGTFDTKYRNWRIETDYNFFWDHFNSQEHLLDIKAKYEVPVEWVKRKRQYAGMAFNTQSYHTSQSFKGLYPKIDSTQGYFHGLYELSPYYAVEIDNISLLLGAKISAAIDSNAKFLITPLVKLSIGFMDNALRFYAHADGGITNNSLYSLSKENNFVSPVVPLKFSTAKYHIQVGISGHYETYLDYRVYIETARFTNMPMYITDTTSRFDNTFSVIYDDGQKFGVGTEMIFETKNWNVNLMAQYNSFTMDTASRAWQKPLFNYKLKASYFIFENIKVTGLIIGQASMYNLYQGEQKVKPWVDVSLLSTYYLNKQLGFFLNINNILAQNYQLWYGYPVQGISIMGGVSFAF